MEVIRLSPQPMEPLEHEPQKSPSLRPGSAHILLRDDPWVLVWLPHTSLCDGELLWVDLARVPFRPHPDKSR